MKFNSIMHVSFHTNKFDEMLDFYVNKLGLELKVLVRYRQYLERDDRPEMQKIAKQDPDKVFNAYIEIAPGQFIELFPAAETQKPHPEWNEYAAYSHYALLVDNIHEVYQKFIDAGVQPDTSLSKGPSGTWQFWVHDPDNNHFEIMQYTDESYQVTGHIDE